MSGVAMQAKSGLNELLREGIALQFMGKFDAAAERYRLAVDADRQDVEALLLLGLVESDRGRHDEAIGWLSRATQERPAGVRYRVNLGHTLRKAGRLEDAERCYWAALEIEPGAAQPWCGLAEVAFVRGDEEQARVYLERARKNDPSSWKNFLHTASTLNRQKKYEEAITVLQRGIAGFPEQAELYLAAGRNALSAEKPARAEEFCRQSIAIDAESPDAYITLARALVEMGKAVPAVLQYERALSRRPDDPEILHGLGYALMALRRHKDAERCFRRCLELKPLSPGYWYASGRAHAELRDLHQAEVCFARAIELDPKAAKHYNARGSLMVFDRPEKALIYFRKAIELEPESAVPHVNLGIAMMVLGRTEEMLAHYQRGAELEPDCAGAQYNLSLAYLRAGRYREGWDLYEHRWNFEELRLRKRHTRIPRWNGEEFQGKTLVLHAEQGLGDAIQFSRFVRLVAERCEHVVLEVPQCLHRLMESLSGPERVVSQVKKLGPFQKQCPLMSLPRLLGTTLENLPTQIPYLSVAKDDVQVMRERFPGDGLRVGLVWAGNPAFRANTSRSMKLEDLLPLLDLEGVNFFSLQKGAGAEDFARVGPVRGLCDAGESFTDFYDTAAMMETLDVVISVDTSTAHLAGALGRPVWVMLPKQSDWRWMDNVETSAWYPTARLFRQDQKGDWAGVVERLRSALELRRDGIE